MNQDNFNEIEPMEVYATIDELRQAKSWTNNHLCSKAGISLNTFQTWRTRKKIPTFEILLAICEALNVHISQIFITHDIAGVIEQEKEVLKLWRTFNSKEKEIILNQLKSFRKFKNTNLLECAEDCILEKKGRR